MGLKDFFGDKISAATKRMRKKVHDRCTWDEVKGDIFPEKGGGAPMGQVVGAILEAKHWPLLTPLVAEAGDWVGVVDLVYRKGEYGMPPPTRAQELEDIYTAIKAAKPHGADVANAYVNTIATWACQHNYEAGYDWAVSKPEFKELSALGLASLADRKIEGNKLAEKVLKTPDDIKRAVEAVDWVYHGHSGDRDDALDHLEAWRKKLEENSKKPPASAPPQPPKP